MQKEKLKKGVTFKIVAPTRAQMCDIVTQFVYIFDSVKDVRIKWGSNLDTHYGFVKITKVCKDGTVYVQITLPDFLPVGKVPEEKLQQEEDQILITSIGDVIEWATHK